MKAYLGTVIVGMGGCLVGAGSVTHSPPEYIIGIVGLCIGSSIVNRIPRGPRE